MLRGEISFGRRWRGTSLTGPSGQLGARPFSDPLAADSVAVAKYLTNLARQGAKVGAVFRRLLAARFAEAAVAVTSQVDDATISTVWEGIRRAHGAPPE